MQIRVDDEVTFPSTDENGKPIKLKGIVTNVGDITVDVDARTKGVRYIVRKELIEKVNS